MFAVNPKKAVGPDPIGLKCTHNDSTDMVIVYVSIVAQSRHTQWPAARVVRIYPGLAHRPWLSPPKSVTDAMPKAGIIPIFVRREDLCGRLFPVA